jgi:hypothetical protein
MHDGANPFATVQCQEGLDPPGDPLWEGPFPEQFLQLSPIPCLKLVLSWWAAAHRFSSS